MKYLVIVSFLLAILTIGAASATADDNATAAVDDSGDVMSAPDGDLDEVVNDADADSKDPYSEDFNPIDIPENVPYKSDENVTFSVKEDIQGVIQVANEGMYDLDSGEVIYNYKNFTLTNGTAFIPLKDYDIGGSPLFFNFIAKGNTSQETADRINSYLHDEEKNMFYVIILPFVLPEYAYTGADVIIKLSTPDGLTGNVSAYYNKKTYYGENNESYDDKGDLIRTANITDGQINLGRWSIGDHAVWFEFENEDGKLYDVLLQQPFPLKVIGGGYNWQIELAPHDEILKTDLVTLDIINVPNDLDGEFELYVDGNSTKFERDFNSIIFNATKLAYGPHAFELKFLGDDNFNPTSLSGTFNLTDVVIEIPKEYDLSEGTSFISVYLLKDATGRIKVTSNGTVIYDEKIETDVIAGDVDREYIMIGIGLNGVKYGLNNVEVNVSGKYQANKKGQVNGVYSLKIAQDHLAYGDNQLSIDVPSDANADVFVIIEGVEYKAVKDNYGIWSYVKVSGNLSVGNHTVVLRYSGDEKYPARDFTYNLTVIPEIKLPPFYLDVKNTDTISLKLPKDATGNLSIKLEKYVKGMPVTIDEKNITVVDGEAVYSLANLSYGKYHVLVNYTGGNYQIISVEDMGYYFTINPDIKYPSKMVEGANDVISIELPGEKGEIRYEAWSNDDDIITGAANIVNGKAGVSLASLIAGNYSIDVSVDVYYDYEGETREYSFSKIFSLVVQKPVIKAADANVVYSANSLYKVQITGVDKDMIAGKIVTFKVNGKAIGTAKVDKNGYASIKITQIPGNYKITAVFNKVSVTKKLGVKHVLKLKKVTVKRSAKKLTIQAALAKVNGKYLKGKKITLKFNGKKLVAKTNKKGVAKFTIKSKVLKKLKKGKKVTYKAAYLKDIVKYTVKVK